MRAMTITHNASTNAVVARTIRHMETIAFTSLSAIIVHAKNPTSAMEGHVFVTDPAKVG